MGYQRSPNRPYYFARYRFKQEHILFLNTVDVRAREGWILPTESKVLVNVRQTEDEGKWSGQVEGSEERGIFHCAHHYFLSVCCSLTPIVQVMPWNSSIRRLDRRHAFGHSLLYPATPHPKRIYAWWTVSILVSIHRLTAARSSRRPNDTERVRSFWRYPHTLALPLDRLTLALSLIRLTLARRSNYTERVRSFRRYPHPPKTHPPPNPSLTPCLPRHGQERPLPNWPANSATRDKA